MRLSTVTWRAIIAIGLLAGCSRGNLSLPSSPAPAVAQGNHLVHGRFVPAWSRFASLIPIELQRTPRAVLDRIAPAGHRKKKGVVGVYGSTFYKSIINGYEGTDPKDRPPLCSLGGSYLNGIAADGNGNLVVPDGGTRKVIIYRPHCGPELGVLDSDPYYLGEPSDAASLNAATGTIIVGNAVGLGGGGDIAVCTLENQCTGYLTNAAMFELAGVALAKNGDCWGSASDASGAASMTYFKHCSGSGETATGWKNAYFGGLDIDTEGDIVAVDAFVPQLWIYRGCNPACTVVAGPFPLHGDTVFGHLNRAGTEWVGADYENGMLDVYKYSTSSLIYEYSISKGLSVSDDVEGAAFSPASRE